MKLADCKVLLSFNLSSMYSLCTTNHHFCYLKLSVLVVCCSTVGIHKYSPPIPYAYRHKHMGWVGYAWSSEVIDDVGAGQPQCAPSGPVLPQLFCPCVIKLKRWVYDENQTLSRLPMDSYSTQMQLFASAIVAIKSSGLMLCNYITKDTLRASSLCVSTSAFDVATHPTTLCHCKRVRQSHSHGLGLCRF